MVEVAATQHCYTIDQSGYAFGARNSIIAVAFRMTLAT
jgi:hypothetical protein